MISNLWPKVQALLQQYLINVCPLKKFHFEQPSWKCSNPNYYSHHSPQNSYHWMVCFFLYSNFYSFKKLFYEYNPYFQPNIKFQVLPQHRQNMQSCTLNIIMIFWDFLCFPSLISGSKCVNTSQLNQKNICKIVEHNNFFSSGSMCRAL